MSSSQGKEVKANRSEESRFCTHTNTHFVITLFNILWCYPFPPKKTCWGLYLLKISYESHEGTDGWDQCSNVQYTVINDIGELNNPYSRYNHEPFSKIQHITVLFFTVCFLYSSSVREFVQIRNRHPSFGYRICLVPVRAKNFTEMLFLAYKYKLIFASTVWRCSLSCFDHQEALKSTDEASQKQDLKQTQWCSWPEGVAGSPREEFSIFGRVDGATEGRVNVSEVVVQRRLLFGTFLRGKNPWGELFQLRRKQTLRLFRASHGKTFVESRTFGTIWFLLWYFNLPVTMRCRLELRTASREPFASMEGWWGCRGSGNTGSCCAQAGGWAAETASLSPFGLWETSKGRMRTESFGSHAAGGRSEDALWGFFSPLWATEESFCEMCPKWRLSA